MKEKDSTTERRNHTRKKAPVLLRSSSVFGQNSQIRNISLGGISIQSQKSHDVGKTLRIEFALPGGDWAEANVRVIWIKKHRPDSGPKYDIGCEFVDMPFDIQNELWVLLDKGSHSH